MNEEKKLTDEEIVNALENQKQYLLEEQERTGNSPDTQLVYISGEVVFEILDLIQRQKAEIERLEKDVHDMSFIIKIHKYCVGADHCQNSSAREFELQKQVDELKLDLENWKKAAYGYKYAEEQAVKDTAKEICKAIHEDLQADLFNLKHSIFDTERQKAQEQQNIGILSAQDAVSRFEKTIKERYGVEVE